MSMYHCEGLVKEIAVKGGKVTFKLEPSAPYVFEKKKDNGTTERSLLFVEEVESPKVAKIIAANYGFSAPESADLHSLIIAKTNRMKVKVVSNLKGKCIFKVCIVFV